MKQRYKLSFLHKFLCICLLVLAILFFCQPQAYKKTFTYGLEKKEISFLQQGDYLVEIYYNAAPADNQIIICSGALTNAENQIETQLKCIDVGRNQGMVQILLELKQDTRNICLKTAQDTSENSYIDHALIQSVQLENTDNYFLGVCCLLGAVIVLLLGWFVPTEKCKMPALLILLGLIASMPLYSGFIVSGDDLGFHVARLEAVYQGMRAGEFPVYLGTNKMGGFGMLSATMYPDLFLYPFALLRFMRVSLMLCYKLLLVCMNIGCAFITYYAAKKLCKSVKIGFWTSVFYTFSIYRLTNIFFRGALGEALAMIFLPLVVWGIYEVLWGDCRKWYILVLGVGGVLQTHVLSAEMCVLFLAIEVAVWLLGKKHNQMLKRIQSGAKAAVITALLNAFFLVPFLFFCREKLQCFDMPNSLAETGLYFSQMFSMFAGAQGSDLELGSTVGEMPHTVGIVLLVGAILLSVEAVKKDKNGQEMRIGKRCLVYGIVALFLSSWLFPWEKLQNIEVLHDVVTSLQFAWRFLGPASVFLAFAAAVGVVRFAECGQGVRREWIYGVCATLVVCGTSYFFNAIGNESEQYGDKMEFNDFGYTDSMYMYSDGAGFKALHLEYDWTDAYIKTMYETNVEYSDYRRNGTHLYVTTEAGMETEDYLLFPLYYYPGYKILVDGESIETQNISSRVACRLPNGTAHIEVFYQGMLSFTLANWVSLFTVLGIVVYNIVLSVKKRDIRITMGRGNVKL